MVRVSLGHVRHGRSGGPGRFPLGVEGGVLDSRSDVEAADIHALAGHRGVQRLQVVALRGQGEPAGLLDGYLAGTGLDLTSLRNPHH